MQGPQTLLEFEDHWVTDIGAWFTGERVVFRGKDLFHEMKDLSWMGLLLYGITGRMPSDKQVRLFEGFWTLSTSYPELRLWNNRVAALAGTVKSTASLGIAAATAVSEATIYGGRPFIWSIDFLYRAQAKLEAGSTLKAIVAQELTQHKILGYGRPITEKDERIQPVMALAKKLKVDGGTYIKLAFEVEKILLKSRLRLNMNIAAVLAGLAADQGFSQREYYHFMVLSFSAGMFPCYQDCHSKPIGSLFPLRCEYIRYEGEGKRSWA